MSDYDAELYENMRNAPVDYSTLTLDKRELGRYGTGLIDFDRDAVYQVQEAAREALEKNRRLMPEPSEHETLRQYRERICDALKGNTKMARHDLSREPPEVFADSERAIITEAKKNYLRPRNVPAGELVQIKHYDPAKMREVIEYGTGQQGNPDPDKYPVSSFKETYRRFRGVGQRVTFLIDDVPQKYNLSPPVLKE